MIKRKILLLSVTFLTSMMVLSSCNNGEQGEDKKDDELLNNHDPFDYDGNFEAPELAVDGVKDEKYTTDGSEVLYVDKDSEHELAATFYRGEKGLFVFFDVKDKNLMSLGDNAGDDVTKSDSVEFYLDTKNDGGAKPQTDDFQFNFGVNNKTRIMQGSGYEWGNWTGLVQYENVLDGTLNDDSDTDVGWKCEVMVSYKDLGITKDSALGVALGRVDKIASGAVADVSYKWYGLTYEGKFIEPQTIDNYISYIGREFYLRENVPLIKNVNGVLKDSSGNVLSDVSISVKDTKVTSGSDGKFSIVNYPFEDNNTFTFVKEGYKTREISITKEDAKLFENDVELGDVTLAKVDEEVKSTFTGSIKNVKNGFVEGASVTINGKNVATNSDGIFTLEATYTNEVTLTVSKEGYNNVTKAVALEDVVPNGTTSLGVISFDLAYTAYSFGGGRQVPKVDGGVTRSLDSLIFKFASLSELKGENGIEFYIDAKSSGLSQDKTDYTFFFNYETGVVSARQFGSIVDMNETQITCEKFKEDDKFVIQVTIKYSAIGVQAGEVIGFSGGVKFNGDWDGFSFADTFVDPKNPSMYVRVGVLNDLYKAINNVGGDVDPFVYLDLKDFGAKYGGFNTLITRDIEDSLFVKFIKKSGDWTAKQRVEFYIDTNTNPTSQRETHTYRIDVVGAGTITNFLNYTGTGGSTIKMPDEDKAKIVATVQKDVLTMQIPYEVLNIKNNATFGISQGVGGEDGTGWDGWGYEENGYSGFVAPEDPTKYVRINGSNEVTKDTLTYTNLGSVGGKSKGEFIMSNLKMLLSRQNDEYMTLKVKNDNHEFDVSRNGKENFEFYIDTGDKARCGEALTNPGANFRDEKVFKIKLACDGTSVDVSYFPNGKAKAVSKEIKEKILPTKIDNNNVSLQINYAALGLTKESVIGFTCGVWSEEIKDWAPYNYIKERRVENAGQYLRLDASGNPLAD